MAPKNSPPGLRPRLLTRGAKTLALLRALALLIASHCLVPPACHAIIDLNRNELSDVWETAYNYTGTSLSVDSDFDGQTNAEEAKAGTDPFDAQSVFRATVPEEAFDCHLVRWKSASGKSYLLESSSAMEGGQWSSHSPVVHGTGGEVLAAVPRTSGPRFFRLRLLETWAIKNGLEKLGPVTDNDGDGLSDVREFVAGTHPFDSASKLSISSVRPGRATTLAWQSVPGKKYQLRAQASDLSAWIDLGAPIPGTGGAISNAVEITGDKQFFRIVVSDADLDADGVSEWEMSISGVRTAIEAARDPIGLPPAQAIQRMLSSTNVVEVSVGTSIANIGTGEPAEFVINRRGNLNRITVRFQLSGDAIAGIDYDPIQSEATLAPGQNQARITVIPRGETGFPAKKLALSLLEDSSYTRATNASAEIRILSELALSVRDFGAVGDGVADDTLPIQAAIDALESSTNHNTLRFPAGIYRLNTLRKMSDPDAVWLQFLQLGKKNLEGRDILFVGEPGSALYSTVSTNRVRMLMVFANFRSLTFRGMTWRKDTNLLPPTTGEPNGAEGVWLLGQGVQKVEAVDFVNCRFDNCHGAVAAYGYGYDARGALNRLLFTNCVVSNPLGPNMYEPLKAYGGGQQVRMNPWVRLALYCGNTFDGGAEEFTPQPTGVRKDGSHFGGPLELVFTNNLVQRMGVEAVFATEDPLMGATSEPFVIPAADGSTAQFKTRRHPTTYRPGQIINIRTWFHSGATATNVFLRVVSFDPVQNAVTVQNDGLTPRVEGLTAPAGQPIYSQDYDPCSAVIADNRIDAGAGYTFNAISSNCRAVIYNNYITGCRFGMHFYPDVRSILNPLSRGTLVYSNVVVTQHSSSWPGRTWGIDSSIPSGVIAHNLIITPRSYFFSGITVRGTNSWIEGNLIFPQVILSMGTNSSLRSVGVGFGHVSTGNTAKGNFTSGLDIGVGPENVNTYPSHRVISHYSTNDLLAVDPAGLVP